MNVHKIIARKGNEVPWVTPNQPISEILDRLEAENVGALIVSRDGNVIEGIICDHDIVRGLRNIGIGILSLPVSKLMTKDVVTCEMHDPIAGIMSLMDHLSIRHLPVVESGKLCGIVAIQDIIRHRLQEVQFDADAMRSYICGSI